MHRGGSVDSVVDSFFRGKYLRDLNFLFGDIQQINYCYNLLELSNIDSLRDIKPNTSHE